MFDASSIRAPSPLPNAARLGADDMEYI